MIVIIYQKSFKSLTKAFRVFRQLMNADLSGHEVVFRLEAEKESDNPIISILCDNRENLVIAKYGKSKKIITIHLDNFFDYFFKPSGYKGKVIFNPKLEW